MCVRVSIVVQGIRCVQKDSKCETDVYAYVCKLINPLTKYLYCLYMWCSLSSAESGGISVSEAAVLTK